MCAQRCACAAGFRLQEDGTNCEDVDECASATACGQLCVNSEGSYHCACQQGYTMELGGRHCKVSGKARWRHCSCTCWPDPDAILNLQVTPTC